MIWFHKEKKTHTCLWVFLVIVGILIGFLAVAGYNMYRSLNVLNGIVSQTPSGILGNSASSSNSFFQILLGMQSPQTYLLLFQNNTEIRPGGGFIGSYAVVRFDHGKPEILKVEGIETLDKAADKSLLPQPPAPIKKYLGVDKWYVRDSNWSPDFAESAKQALALYRLENGTAADQINTVIAITPTFVEGLLSRVGTTTIQGIPFTPQNFTEKLEYEVEYGYADRGTSFAKRKSILDPFMRELALKVGADFFLHSDAYATLLETLSREKHLVAYSDDAEIARVLAEAGIDGKIKQTQNDFLLWVDANLAALKTDHAMERSLSYSIYPDSKNNRLIAKAAMTYVHTGKFDWRTTRYRSYVRVFVPSGSVLIGVSTQGARGATIPFSAIDQGEELGKTWFGTFISIEPGETRQLIFEYALPNKINESVQSGFYDLTLQKQIGTVNTLLTLNLQFDKKVTAAAPAEVKEKWGDSVYNVQGDLRHDESFEVKF
ncbi:MAG: DUF4012 domain-containing protein [Candidatus Magasanikbacteria bacterium]|nr:DUF4012 domain-containing protein [Candidatus Magasanikbacteria bacterium]